MWYEKLLGHERTTTCVSLHQTVRVGDGMQARQIVSWRTRKRVRDTATCRTEVTVYVFTGVQLLHCMLVMVDGRVCPPHCILDYVRYGYVTIRVERTETAAMFTCTEVSICLTSGYWIWKLPCCCYQLTASASLPLANTKTLHEKGVQMLWSFWPLVVLLSNRLIPAAEFTSGTVLQENANWKRN